MSDQPTKLKRGTFRFPVLPDPLPEVTPELLAKPREKWTYAESRAFSAYLAKKSGRVGGDNVPL